MEVHGVLAGCGGKWSALWEWAVELVSVRLAVVWEGAVSRSVPDPCVWILVRVFIGFFFAVERFRGGEISLLDGV